MAMMMKMELFRITMPKVFIKKVVIPAINLYFGQKLTLGEFFYMAWIQSFHRLCSGDIRLQMLVVGGANIDI